MYTARMLAAERLFLWGWEDSASTPLEWLECRHDASWKATEVDDRHPSQDPSPSALPDAQTRVLDACVRLAHYIAQRLFVLTDADEFLLAIDDLIEDEHFNELNRSVAQSAADAGRQDAAQHPDNEWRFITFLTKFIHADAERLDLLARLLREHQKAKQTVAAWGAKHPAQVDRATTAMQGDGGPLGFLTDTSIPSEVRAGLLASERARMCRFAILSMAWEPGAPGWIVSALLDTYIDSLRGYLAVLIGFPGVDVPEDLVPRPRLLLPDMEAAHQEREARYNSGLTAARDGDFDVYPPVEPTGNGA